LQYSSPIASNNTGVLNMQYKYRTY